MKKQVFRSRRFRQGSMGAAITVVVLALIVVVNLIAGTLTEKYHLSKDLTANKFFGLSQQSIDFLQGLNQKVELIVLNSEENFTAGNDYYVQANEVLQQYQRQAPAYISLKYVDIVRNPEFVSQYPELQLTANAIILSGPYGQKVVSTSDLFNIESSYYGYGPEYITSSKAEQAMTSALLQVTSEKAVKVSLITGHNEIGLSDFASMLELNNFEVKEQNLITEEIDPEAAIAIILSPTRDFTEDQLKKLDAFLGATEEKSRSLLYFASTEQPDLPVLEAFLEEWGVAVGRGVVFETNQSRIVNMSPFFALVDYAEENFSKVGATDTFPTVPYARPLELLPQRSNIATQTLLSFSDTAGVRPMDAPEDWQPTAESLRSGIPALILAQKTSYVNNEVRNASVVVCGSSVAIDPSILQQTYFSNSAYFLNLLSELSGKHDNVFIEPKALGGNTLGINTAQMIVIAFVLVVLLPLVVFVVGISTWLRRRHR